MATPNHNDEYDDQETRHIGEEENYSSYDPDPETRVLYESDSFQEAYNQEWADSGEYDFSLDNLIEDYKSQFAYNNLPAGHKYGDWVAKSDYDGLYDAMIDVAEISQDTISSFYQQYQQLSTHAQERETLIDSLRNQVNQYSNQDRASSTFNERRQRDLDERERSIEAEKKKNKAVLYGSIGLAAIMTILMISFLFMWQGAKNDSESEAQRGSAHQERISELESSLQSSRTDLSNAQSQNKELQTKLDSANKRAEDAEKAVKDVRKQSEEKDKEIEKLNQDIEKLEEEPVTSTVTQTPDAQTITSTITRVAPPSDEHEDEEPATQ